MCISGTDGREQRAGKTAFVYLLISCFCALFGAVYETFSHEVYSFYMIYAFAFPLVGGAAPFAALSLSRTARYPSAPARELYHAGIATLTAGSVVRGILDIYGTTSSLSRYYWIVGALAVAAGLAVDRLAREKPDQQDRKGVAPG